MNDDDFVRRLNRAVDALPTIAVPTATVCRLARRRGARRTLVAGGLGVAASAASSGAGARNAARRHADAGRELCAILECSGRASTAVARVAAQVASSRRASADGEPGAAL